MYFAFLRAKIKIISYKLVKTYILVSGFNDPTSGSVKQNFINAVANPQRFDPGLVLTRLHSPGTPYMAPIRVDNTTSFLGHLLLRIASNFHPERKFLPLDFFIVNEPFSTSFVFSQLSRTSAGISTLIEYGPSFEVYVFSAFCVSKNYPLL